EFLGTLQALTLLARGEDVARSQWDGAAHKQKQQGTLVYHGVVYDHIQYSNRGQGSAYIAGKNKWGLKFNRGHKVPLIDHDGLSVSIQSGIKHTPSGMPDAPKVWQKFLSELRANPDEDWCRKNLDLKAYYSFHALNRLLGNVDLRPDGNHGYYCHPDGRWAPI